jgi:hypothetical protein
LQQTKNKQEHAGASHRDCACGGGRSSPRPDDGDQAPPCAVAAGAPPAPAPRGGDGRSPPLSMRKVVLILTSKSIEIYLSMTGAKRLVTRGLSWFRSRPYVQQWCARGTILRCTMVLAEGSNKRGGRGGRASRSLRFLIEAGANIGVEAVNV